MYGDKKHRKRRNKLYHTTDASDDFIDYRGTDKTQILPSHFPLLLRQSSKRKDVPFKTLIDRERYDTFCGKIKHRCFISKTCKSEENKE